MPQKNNTVFHLWWHPHNFGKYQDENFAVLQKILEHYQYLNKEYGYKSMSMGDLSNYLSMEN